MHGIPIARRSHGLEVRAACPAEFQEILSPAALDFVTLLLREFDGRRRELLQGRIERQFAIDDGALPDFLPGTRAIREAQWVVAAPPSDLVDRRVELTGPAERKMVVNGLNSGANVFLADFEDANSPTWRNMIQGQINLRDAVRRTIRYTSPQGKLYELAPQTATLMVRPRGWHLVDKHLLLDGEPVSGALVDFGLYLFHNAHPLVERGSGPYFYLPKLENYFEARLWNDVFVFAQQLLGLERGTIRATVLIETILAAFEMEEILYELREHSAGLNCGRWDYIFSIIKKFRHDPTFVMPDRARVTMTTHGLRSYSLLAIQSCHRRGAHAIGGMAAQIPIKRDPRANERALDHVRADKEREAGDGHDGTWVAHPGLVGVARAAFDARLGGPHQIANRRDDVLIMARDLLTVPAGPITEQGLRYNLDVGIQYLGAWLAGTGCVPIYDLMEDAATAEISRAQVWQWIRHDGRLEDGRRITAASCRGMVRHELRRIRESFGAARFAAGRYETAAQLIEQIVSGEGFPEFMTSVAYEHLD